MIDREDVLDLGSWCILRTASADTLKVPRELNAAGLTAWTPIEKRFGKMPRTGAPFDKLFALIPTYVFARAEDIGDLLRLSHAPNGPKFTLLRYREGYPLIADAELNALRQEEDRKQRVFDRWKRRGMKAAPISVGTQVRMTEGPFAGYSGVVEDAQGQFTLVNLEGFPQPIKIASLLVADSVVSSDVAARAA